MKNKIDVIDIVWYWNGNAIYVIPNNDKVTTYINSNIVIIGDDNDVYLQKQTP